jgi:restriction system protein
MARTYYSESRQLVNLLNGIFVLFSFCLVFLWLEENNFILLISLLFGSVFFSELIGKVYLKRKRAKKKKTKPVPTKTKELKNNALWTKNIDTLSGNDFERLIELCYKEKGYEVTRVGGAGDHEVDLILKGKEGYKIAVQCKRWKKNVGNDTVLRLKAGKQVHGCYDAWIVTTSNYTKSAKVAAERLNIRLINGAFVHDMVRNLRRKNFG